MTISRGDVVLARVPHTAGARQEKTGRRHPGRHLQCDASAYRRRRARKGGAARPLFSLDGNIPSRKRYRT
jgi:hypothetical protein